MPFRPLTAIVALLLSLPVNADNPISVTIYGDEAYPPYSFVEAGEFKGIYVDYLRKLNQRVQGYRINIKPIPWKRGLAMLKTGEAFALFPPYQFADRDYIHPYSLPLNKESIVITCSSSVMTHPRREFQSDFSDVTLGINGGYLLSESLQAAIKLKQIHIDEARGNEINIRKLAAGRIGCYVNDRLSIHYALSKLKADPRADATIKELKLIDTVEIASQTAYIAYSAVTNLPYKADFIDKLNTAIRESEKQNELKALIDTYTR